VIKSKIPHCNGCPTDVTSRAFSRSYRWTILRRSKFSCSSRDFREHKL